MQEVTKSAESWLHIVIYPAGACEAEQEAGEVQQPAAFFAFSFFFFNSPPAAHNFLLHPLVLTFSEVQLFKKGCLLLVASCLSILFSEALSNLYRVDFTCTNVLTHLLSRAQVFLLHCVFHAGKLCLTLRCVFPSETLFCANVENSLRLSHRPAVRCPA